MTCNEREKGERGVSERTRSVHTMIPVVPTQLQHALSIQTSTVPVCCGVPLRYTYCWYTHAQPRKMPRKGRKPAPKSATPSRGFVVATVSGISCIKGGDGGWKVSAAADAAAQPQKHTKQKNKAAKADASDSKGKNRRRKLTKTPEASIAAATNGTLCFLSASQGKDERLVYLLLTKQQSGTAIAGYSKAIVVLSAPTAAAQALAALLKTLGMAAYTLPSNMSKHQRSENLTRYKAETCSARSAVLIIPDAAVQRTVPPPNEADLIVHYNAPAGCMEAAGREHMLQLLSSKQGITVVHLDAQQQQQQHYSAGGSPDSDDCSDSGSSTATTRWRQMAFCRNGASKVQVSSHLLCKLHTYTCVALSTCLNALRAQTALDYCYLCCS
jgi:hypothetical protein